MAGSPTSRTLEEMRKRGFALVQVVEKWNPHARVRQDLFGIIDVLCVAGDDVGVVVGVQATSYSNIAARVNKIAEHESTPHLREAGWRLLVHGWKKNRRTGRWELREVDVS